MGGYMIKLLNFDNIVPSYITYGGHSGSKKGILINNERWFLKYPKSTKSMNVVDISYTTSPLSEYLGSHIYKLLGFDVHETKLGISNNKLVVACKDFLANNETILDYNSLKNDYDEIIEQALEDLFSTSNLVGTDLYEILLVMDNNTYFEKVPELHERFWDMFVVDALINNNDRNDSNWGLVINHDTLDLRIAPVYDNGASFYSKTGDEKLSIILNDALKKKQVLYDSAISAFLLHGKIINPIKYIEDMDNVFCDNAILRVFPKIDLNKIKELFDSIPDSYDGVAVFSKEQRALYYESIEYKYNIFKSVYYKLKEYNK